MSDTNKPPDMLILASQAAPRMNLVELTLLRSQVERSLATPTGPEIELHSNFGFKTTHERNKDAKTLNVIVQYFSQGKFAENDSEQDLFKLEAHYVVVYSYSGDDEIASDSVEAFAKINSVYNAWPYFREYVQCTTGRMGLPPVTLPLITGHRIRDMIVKQEEKLAAKLVEPTPKGRPKKKSK